MNVSAPLFFLRSVPLITVLNWKLGQPAFAPDRPALVSWNKLIRLVQSPEVHFNFIAGPRENRRPAAGTKIAPGKVCGLTGNFHGAFMKYRGGIKQCAVVFAAIQTMTNADPVRLTGCNKPHLSTKTSARKSRRHLFASACNLVKVYGGQIGLSMFAIFGWRSRPNQHNPTQ